MAQLVGCFPPRSPALTGAYSAGVTQRPHITEARYTAPCAGSLPFTPVYSSQQQGRARGGVWACEAEAWRLLLSLGGIDNLLSAYRGALLLQVPRERFVPPCPEGELVREPPACIMCEGTWRNYT